VNHPQKGTRKYVFRLSHEGKYVGVLAFVGFQMGLFVALTWLALGLRTGVWDGAYSWCLPLLLLEFAVFYSFSALLAVLTRSTVVCVVGSVLFWLVCWGMNFGRHVALATPELKDLRSFGAASELAYWVLPKPADLTMLLSQALDGGHAFGAIPAFEEVKRMGAFSPDLSVLTSLAFAVAVNQTTPPAATVLVASR